jgi:transcription antitermination factor NusG
VIVIDPGTPSAVGKVLPIKDGEAVSEIWQLSSNPIPTGDAVLAAKEMQLQWYAVYTTPRHEKHVAQLLAERDIETCLPLYRTVRQWKKSCPILLELPLFPCYLFVRVRRSARGSVLSMPGVLSIVGSPKEPWPLPHFEIEALRIGAQMGKIQPHPYLKVGERVRVATGSMAGVEGILVRKKNQFRFVLTLDAIMRSVAVEVDANDLEPVDQPADLTAAPAASMVMSTN